MQYSQKLDHFIVAILFSLSGVVLLELLNIEYQYPFSSGEKVDVGIIKYAFNNVRKKSIDHASWTDAKNTTRIFNNDKIFTDNNAKATLEFKSGNELIVSEESLLKISFLNNVFNLDVEKGSFLANLSSDEETFLLLLDGREYKLKSKKGSVRITDKKLSVISGDAVIASGDQVISLKEGQVTDLSKSSLEVSIDFPANLNIEEVREFYILPEKEISLSWKWEREEELELSISKNVDFKDSKIVGIKNNSASIVLEEGLYYAKFRNVKRDEFSTTRQFKVIYERVPLVELNKTVFFQGQSLWANVNGESFEEYNIILNEKKVLKTSNSFSRTLDEVGDFEIYAQGEDSRRPYALKSKALSYKVIPLPTTGPALLMPGDGQEFYFYGKNKVELTLKSLYDVDYGFVINDVEYSSFAPSLNYEVSQNQTMKIKTFYNIDNKKIYGDTREVYIFIDDSTGPEESGRKFILKKPGQEVSFDWNSAGSGASEKYLLEVSVNSNFSKIIKSVKTTDVNAKVNFQEVGELFWRVKKVLLDGSTEFSKPEKLILLKPAPPPSPTIKKFIQKRVTSYSFFLKVLDIFIQTAQAQEEAEEADRLEWDSVEGVDKYQIEITDMKTGKVIHDKTLSAPSFSLDLLAPGNYKYRVASIDYWGQKGEFSEYSEIEIKKVSLEIKLIYPQHGKNIEASKQLFEWRLDKEISKKKQSFQVEFSHDLAFSASANFQVADTKLEVDLFQFVGQNIYWRVVDSQDRGIISKRRLLKVKEKKENKVEVKIIHNLEAQRDRFKFSYMPSKYKSELEEITIDGNNLISFGISYQKNSNTSFSFYKSSGEVFEGLDFASNEFVLSHLLGQGKFSYGAGVSLKYATGYKVRDEKIEEARFLNTSVFLEFGYRFFSVNFSGRFYIGSESGFEIKTLKDVKSLKYLREFGLQFQSRKSDELGDVIIFGPIFSY